MKLQLLRFGLEADLSPDKVQTLEVLDRSVFSRVVTSLLSEEGENASEPYALWDGKGKRLNPKKHLLVLNELPRMPFNNRTFLNKLYGRLVSQLELNGRVENINDNGRRLLNSLASESIDLWGTYGFDLEWNTEALLKAFSFVPACSEADSFLDSCTAFFGFCIDIQLGMPLVFVNAKSFLTDSELDSFIEQAIFCGVEVLLLESWHDDLSHRGEQKIVLDQELLVS